MSRIPVVRGTDIRDASAAAGELNRWETNFVLTQEAAKKFGAYTEANIGQRAAIVVDGIVISAPTIQSKISDTGRITGAASQEEAADLALNLRAGSLPAALTIEEERTVGPSLGADSIREGFAAGIAGVVAVVLFMLVYYRRSGINATLALVLNAVILIAALAYFDATLTLPGIAGIILTIGMAVDSNVLIFERIREELRAGKAVVAAVDAGFSKAFLTIIDTHVTTVVSCAFLFIFGTGPVKGFAVTLVIGLVANLFTAVFVSRTIFDCGAVRQAAGSGFEYLMEIEFLTGGNCFPPSRCLTLSDAGAATGDMELFKHSDFDFLGKKWPFIILSLVLTAAGFISLAVKGGPRYGIDFRGGALITVSFANRPPVDKVRAALSGKLPVEVQEVSGRPEDIIGIDALQDAALQASRQKVIDTPGCGVRTAGQRQIQYQLRWRRRAGRSSAGCLGRGQRSDVGPATADAGVQHHGLPEAAFRTDQEPG